MKFYTEILCFDEETAEVIPYYKLKNEYNEIKRETKTEMTLLYGR